MKYKKKPIIVEAEQWLPGKEIESVYNKPIFDMPLDIAEKLNDNCAAMKIYGNWHIVLPGDWIITDLKGEKYPCKNDIFKETYEESV